VSGAVEFDDNVVALKREHVEERFETTLLTMVFVASGLTAIEGLFVRSDRSSTALLAPALGEIIAEQELPPELIVVAGQNLIACARGIKLLGCRPEGTDDVAYLER